MIRRLVNGFVHDIRPPQLHMFLSETDRMLSSSPAVFGASSAQETEKDISPAERERVRKLIHRLPRFWWSCFKDEFETVASASWLSCLDAAHGRSAAGVIRVSNPVTPKMHNKSRWQRLQNCGRR